MLERGLGFARAAKFGQAVTVALDWLSATYFRMYDYENALPHYETLLALLQKGGRPKDIERVRHDLGLTYFRMGPL